MAQPQTSITNLMSLDVGGRRIGVAATNVIARLPRPVGVVLHDDMVWDSLAQLVRSEQIDAIVVGLPRNMNGQETAQTQAIRDFVAQLQQHIALPITFQDETLTSRQAEQELAARGKHFSKGDIDALAAVYILEDYLRTEYI